MTSFSFVGSSETDMSATIGPIVPTPDERFAWRIRWNENWQGKPKYYKKLF
jgi:hypothetical protein